MGASRGTPRDRWTRGARSSGIPWRLLGGRAKDNGRRPAPTEAGARSAIVAAASARRGRGRSRMRAHGSRGARRALRIAAAVCAVALAALAAAAWLAGDPAEIELGYEGFD